MFVVRIIVFEDIIIIIIYSVAGKAGSFLWGRERMSLWTYWQIWGCDFFPEGRDRVEQWEHMQGKAGKTCTEWKLKGLLNKGEKCEVLSKKNCAV